MNQAQIRIPGTPLLRADLPGVSFDVDPALQHAAARRLLSLARLDGLHLSLRSHQRDYTTRVTAAVVDPGAPANEPRTKRSRYRQEQMLAIVGAHPQGISRADLAQAVGLPSENLSSPIKRMIAAGQLRCSGTRGAYRYHRVQP